MDQKKRTEQCAQCREAGLEMQVWHMYGSIVAAERSMSLLSRAGKVVCSSKELIKAPLPKVLVNKEITLALNNKISKMKNP